jgi:magnesium-transporting ATPase (P-type)
MITGDHAATARAIAVQLGLADNPTAVTGADLDGLGEDEFRATAIQATVFARTSPEHKLRLVEALQMDGSVIAMTGDGVNDAPALKRADVGVAMGGKGTEAAKDASEMVLADDNFASIVAAVREGRTVYDNLTKVISWTLADQRRRIDHDHAGHPAGVALPVTPLQILWVNMVSSVSPGAGSGFRADGAEDDAPPAAPAGQAAAVGLCAVADPVRLDADGLRYLRRVRVGPDGAGSSDRNRPDPGRSTPWWSWKSSICSASATCTVRR